MSIRYVYPSQLEGEDPRILALLQEAFQYQHDDNDFFAFFQPYFDGRAMLLVVEDEGELKTAVLGEFTTTACGAGFRVTLAAGTFLQAEGELEEFGAFLKTHGFAFIEGWVRESVARLLTRLNFTPVYTIVRKEL